MALALARYADYTEVGDRAAALAYKPPPLPKPSSPESAEAQHYYVRVSISPTSERDCGIIIEGTFTVSEGTARVYDVGGKLLSSSPFKPG
jgi:hypothetical protein